MKSLLKFVFFILLIIGFLSTNGFTFAQQTGLSTSEDQVKKSVPNGILGLISGAGQSQGEIKLPQSTSTRFGLSHSQEPNTSPSEIRVRKSVTPNEILSSISGASLSQEESKLPQSALIELSITGYGGIKEEKLPVNVVFSIDSSSSMAENDPSNLRLEAAKSFVDKLTPSDGGGIVSWDSRLDFAFGITSDFAALKTNIEKSDNKGGTNLNVGLASAIKMLDKNKSISHTNSTGSIVFLSDGKGDYIKSGMPGSLADSAREKGYKIFTIGLNIPKTSAESDLKDIASATGGQYFSAPTAQNLQRIFDAIFQKVISNTAPVNLDLIETTPNYMLVDAKSFSIIPDKIEKVENQNSFIWKNISRFVGNRDARLGANESFSVNFLSKFLSSGNRLPVDVDGISKVTYTDPSGKHSSTLIPQVFLNVISSPDQFAQSGNQCNNSSHAHIPGEIDKVSANKTGSIAIRVLGNNSKSSELLSNITVKVTPIHNSKEKAIVLADNRKLSDCNSTPNVMAVDGLNYGSYVINQVTSHVSDKTILNGLSVSINSHFPNLVIVVGDRKFVSMNANASMKIIPNQFIVTLQNNLKEDPGLVASQIAKITGGKIRYVYSYLTKGFSIEVPMENIHSLIQELSADPRVVAFENNQFGVIAQAETIRDFNENRSANIKRILEDLDGRFPVNNTSIIDLRKGTKGPNIDVDIAVIDTGISLRHPDLNVYRNVSFVSGAKNGDDDNGHGTHVAGIMAAKDNGFGVVGLAPGARLWALKVCNASGICPVDAQKAAVEYTAKHAGEIDEANISIENHHSQALDDMITRSVAAGVTYTVAAGNGKYVNGRYIGIDASNISPADAPSAITVSAIADSDGKCGAMGSDTQSGKDDTLAEFSNYGSVVDIAAPGVDIPSTWIGPDWFRTESGTSMAAPHVGGIVALYKASHPGASPEEVKNWLLYSGSHYTDDCNSAARGYFYGDPDGDDYPEPLVHAVVKTQNISASTLSQK